MTAGPADPKALQVLPSWVSGSPVPPGSRIGKILQNEYLLKGLLGEGELGVTYEAENTRLRGRWAVLMLKRELKPTQGMMLQVRDDLRKAEPLAKLGLMPVRMIIDQHQIPGFATELLEGETLRRRLQRGPLRVERALAVALQVARALEALHKAGAVHGDLRPENIFLVRPTAKSAYAGKVVIVEHSFHHLRRREPGLDDKLPLYKLMYRPPELLLGERGPHPGADVFDLGAILHEALTGKPAFYADDADFVLDNLGQPPKSLEPRPSVGLSAALAEQISVLITSACVRDPDERLPDMGEFIAAIEQIVSGSGLKLPDVVVEAAESTPEVPAAPSDQRMARVLERRSGVFAIIAPPGAAPTPAPASAPAPAPASSAPVAPAPVAAPSRPEVAAAERPTSPPVAEPAPARVPEPPAELKPNLPQTITAPKKKVTRLLQALSGSFPVLTVSPDGSRIEESLSKPSDPQIAPPTGIPEAVAPPASPSSPEPAAAAPAAPPPAASSPPVVPPVSAAPSLPVSEAAGAAPVASPAGAPAAEPSPSPAALAPSAAPPAEPAPSPATAAPAPAAAPTPAAAPAPVAPAAPVRPAGIPADLARALLQSRQKTPPAAEPSAAPPPAPVAPPPGPPAATAAREGAAHPEAQKVTVPPVAPAAPDLGAAGAGGVIAAVGSLLASERAAPAGPAPTPQAVPATALPSREITLAGDELIEAAEGPKQPPSISDALTRPLLAAVNLIAPPATPPVDRPPFTEQATQPVLRRFPIEEQATQAKLPALDAISAQPTVSAPSVSAPPPVELVTATPPPSPLPPPVPPAPAPEPAASSPPAAAPPKAPRVSQLIQALQRGEMEAVKAITEAARSHAAATPPATPPAPSVSAAQPSTPASGSPLPGRVSPGLVAPISPLPPTSTGSPEAAIATTKVATNPKLPLAGQAGLRAFIVRHQEAVSMIAGAVLMLLIGLLVLALLH